MIYSTFSVFLLHLLVVFFSLLYCTSLASVSLVAKEQASDNGGEGVGVTRAISVLSNR